MKDYYYFLGIPKDASAEDIKKAYDYAGRLLEKMEWLIMIYMYEPFAHTITKTTVNHLSYITGIPEMTIYVIYLMIFP